MSRISKWKIEKTKVKVVFRLQFHATHIPATGWDKLFISFIPADTGKTTAKTTKANVRNGTCNWADPIYETTRLLQDSKSKQYDEKFYKIVVAMGSSRASTLGEATINLADYVDALKPFVVSLPLHGCSFGTILHITVQLLTSKTGFREFEQQRELRERGLQTGVDAHGKTPHSEEASTRIKVKADINELPTFEEEVNWNEECADSAAGFDGSSNTSDSLYAEKHETSSTHEIDSLKSATSGDLHVISHFQSPSTGHEDPSHNSINNELSVAYVENNRLRASSELAESSLSNLKTEVESLQSIADELGTETQNFSSLLAAEIFSSEALAKEVSVMKSECLKFKDDITQLKDLKFNPPIHVMETSVNPVDDVVQTMQLQLVKVIAVVEGKIRELQNKALVATHDGDTKYIFLELEALLNFLMDFKLGNGLLSEGTNMKEIIEPRLVKDEQFVCGNGLGMDLRQPDSILLSMTSPVSEAVNPSDAIEAMEGQIFDLVREIDEAKVEKEALTRKMDQMECYYEALIHDLEENQKRMLGELQILRNEHSTCLYTLSASRAEMEAVRQDLNHQVLRSLDERNSLEALNRELEKRATTSEAALRRARLNYSIAVDKLQKDLELLSSQVMSLFETNENLIKQTLPSQGHMQEVDDATRLAQCQNQDLGLRKRSMGGDILSEDLKKSFCMQEQLYQKVQEELLEMYIVNLGLDIFSVALRESLCVANDDIRIMKGNMDELVEELELSTSSQNHLIVRLQKATDDIHALNEYKSSSISQFSDMALQNQLLEDKLASISEENCLLAQKLKDFDGTMMEYSSYRSKYGVCLAENTELSLSLEKEVFENQKLKSEMSLLEEKLKILKADSDALVSSKENLEDNVNFVLDKLPNLLAAYNKQFCSSTNSQIQNLKIMDIKDAIFQLEEIQQNACSKVSELMKEKENLRTKSASADVSLSAARSEILTMKHKFISDIQEMVSKLDASNALVDKLQAQLETVASKLHFGSEIEEKYALQNKLLLDDLALLEDQMQKLTCQNGNLAREISGFDALAEELGNSKLTITELMHDKQELAMSLQSKIDESIQLSRNISSLEENLKVLQDELHKEKSLKDELEGRVNDLTSHMNQDQDKLLEFKQQIAELGHVKELASDLELEKSRLAHLLSQQNVLIQKLEKNNSCRASLESQLLEIHGVSLQTEVKLIYVSNQYEGVLDELIQQLISSEGCLKELQKRYHYTKSMLNQSLVNEAHLSEEKANLLTTLERLRSDLEVYGAQEKLLSDSNNDLRNQLEECKAKMETSLSVGKNTRASEVERLKNMMIDAEEEIGHLIVSKEELEIMVLLLKGKVDELSSDLTLQEGYKEKLMKLQTRCSELSHKLSEQVLKSEEFKNLSTHLKELKDKAEAECLLARERREPEGSPVAVQDSLRIAFMKEQYETKIQELKLQLSISKKHGEEMLMKLQDSIDEIENRKKSEAVSLKKNEELSLRLSALEEELQSALVEKREKSSGYDRMKAELECALLSLECCKEEKEKLKASFLEFEAEKSQLAIELTSIKAQLENLKSSANFGMDHVINGSSGNSTPVSSYQDEIMGDIKRENGISTVAVENADSIEPVKLQIVQDDATKGMDCSPIIEEFSQSDGENSDLQDEHFVAQKLRSSMEHLHEELEKMKHENRVFNMGHYADSFRVPERELMQLHKANEELRSMFPLFTEIPGGGNALERVLALEIELAEALKSKNKLSLQFQSSFLKQHSDEEAVFKSFRDINELIKEMLELKGRHASMEADLRDMHDRYSQLSLQFAEVEGERQKLSMTLKNLRASRKLNTSLSQSNSDNVMDHPS